MYSIASFGHETIEVRICWDGRFALMGVGKAQGKHVKNVHGQFNVTSGRLLLSPMSRHAAARDVHLCFAANISLFWICIPSTDDLHPLCCSQQTKVNSKSDITLSMISSQMMAAQQRPSSKRGPSGAWSRLKTGPVDPLESYGLPSKGETRFVHIKLVECG